MSVCVLECVPDSLNSVCEVRLMYTAAVRVMMAARSLCAVGVDWVLHGVSLHPG